MSSCDAADVQVKNFSPPFRRARETRAGTTDPRFCQAEKNGELRCPDGYCRCSGELRKQVETRDHPWGAPDSTPGTCKPPAMTQPELDAALAAAKANRASLRGDVVPTLEALIAKAKSTEAALGADEVERIRELVEWLELLKAE